MADILRPGDPKRVKLDKYEDEVKRFKGEIATRERGLLTGDDIRAALARGLDRALEAAGTRFHTFDGFSAPDGEFHNHKWPDEPTWGALVALYGKAELIERAAAYVETIRRGEPGLPLAERPGAIARLREKLEAAERKEELEIVRIEAEGLTVLRREDVNVELVLEVHRGLEGGRAEAQPGPSEPERAPLNP